MRRVSTVAAFGVYTKTSSVREDGRDSAREADLKIRPEEKPQTVGSLHSSLIDLLAAYFIKLSQILHLMNSYCYSVYSWC